MKAHIFLTNKVEDGYCQEIQIFNVDSIKQDEFYLSIYGTLHTDEEHEIMGKLIGSFLSCDVVGFYMEEE